MTTPAEHLRTHRSVEQLVPVEVDVLILGSGFAATLLALILRRLGRSCLLLDRLRHPRFAIGESSTPLADFALRALAQRYDLPRIAPLTMYGPWRRTYPEVMRGLKRGFSYYQHTSGESFRPTPNHHRELMVAASTADETADTHWLRADVDQFLANEAVDAGAMLFEEATVSQITAGPHHWEVEYTHAGQTGRCRGRLLIDGSGEGGALAKTLGIADERETLATHSRGLFGHFTGVIPWHDMLSAADANAAADHPFYCDHAAVHQVLDGAWMWQLRFDNDVLSAGFAIDPRRHPLDSSLSPEAEWDQWMARYPSLQRQFSNARLIAPDRLRRTGRMQRLLAQAAGPQWAMLPHTAGFIDPLHSTGIAFALSGVRHLAEIIEQTWGQPTLNTRLAEYGTGLRQEVQFIDRIVANCYAAIPVFPVFTLACKLYFVCAIYCERNSQRMRPGGFLGADQPALRNAVFGFTESLQRVRDERSRTAAPIPKDDESLGAELRTKLLQQLAGYELAGLFDPSYRNMHRHTSAPK